MKWRKIDGNADSALSLDFCPTSLSILEELWAIIVNHEFIIMNCCQHAKRRRFLQRNCTCAQLGPLLLGAMSPACNRNIKQSQSVFAAHPYQLLQACWGFLKRLRETEKSSFWGAAWAASELGVSASCYQQPWCGKALGHGWDFWDSIWGGGAGWLLGSSVLFLFFFFFFFP